MIAFPSILQGDRKPIRVVNRRTGQQFEEVVAGEDAMRVFYGTPIGLSFTTRMLTNQWVSKIFGAYNDSSASRHKIQPFVEELGIDITECEKDLTEYNSFNDFFARKLKPGSRPIESSADTVVSPGDGRLLVFDQIEKGMLTYLKWAPIELLTLFGHHEQLATRYEGGQALVLRLCPADYHRFHFPVSGRVGITKTIDGQLHSVNPYAIESNLPVYCLNKRTICEIESPTFGKVLQLEIGALLVGSIVQTYRAGKTISKGDEKGYFKFGGSTSICFFEKGRIQFDPDLIENSKAGFETLVQMGEQIATKTQ